MSVVAVSVAGMYETSADVRALDDLLTASRAGGTAHLQAIISNDAAPSAVDLLPQLVGMRILALSTVTRSGEPRVSAVDGHFLRGQWTFGTDGGSAKARHLAARPSVSAALIEGESLGVFVHGRVERVTSDDPWHELVVSHWTEHYGTDPFTWGDDIRMYRIVPSWMVAYRRVSDGESHS